jgi:Ricin-type beta-trefoil lectin domain
MFNLQFMIRRVTMKLHNISVTAGEKMKIARIARRCAVGVARKTKLASRRPIQLLIAGTIALTMTLSLTGVAFAKPGPFYWIINQHSGQALLPLNHLKDHGTEIVQNFKGNFGAQNWKIRVAGTIDEVERIRLFDNRHSKYCISASDSQPGRVLRQVQCQNWSQREEWVVSNRDDMFAGRPFTVWNRYSGLCMDVAGASTAEYARIIQWPCHGGANQIFRLSYVQGT